MKKRTIALAVCCSLVCSSAWAKTFVGVLYPLFGPMAAIGLVELAGELKAMPDVEVATYLHQSWKSLVDDINRQPKGTRIVIVGYSLGANNAILVANNVGYVDSIVALQPSMLTSQDTLTGKVGKIIEIYNPNPWMTFGGMGSQKLDAPNIEYVVNNDTHPGAQFSDQFRSIVRSEVARVLALDTLQAAPAKTFRPSQLAKLPPPKDAKDTKPNALAFANPDPPKHEQAKREQPKPAQAKVEQAKVEQARVDQAKVEPARYDPPAREQNPPSVFADAPKPVFADAFLTTANAGVLFQRSLTISDMKDYVNRTYQNR